MKKYLYSLLVGLFTFTSVLLSSCSNLNGNSESSVSFNFSKDVFRTAASLAESKFGVSDDFSLSIELTLFTENGTKLSSQSESHTASEWESLLSSNNPKLMAFGKIPAGLKVYAVGEILNDSNSIFKGQSEVITVKVGGNKLRLVLKASGIPADGTIIFENSENSYILAQNIEKSSKKFYLNQAVFAYSLLDEDGNDYLAQFNGGTPDSSWKCSWELSSGNNKLYSGENSTSTSLEILSFENSLNASGTYLLTLMVSHGTDFEPVSGTFEITVEDTLVLAYSINETDENYISFNPDVGSENPAYVEFTQAINNHNVNLKLSGSSDTSFGNDIYYLKQATSDSNHNLYLDMTDLSDSEGNVIESSSFDGWDELIGLILPKNLTKLILSDGRNSSFIFQNCGSLEEVVFPVTEGWYSSDVYEPESVSDSNSLTLINVTNPQVNAEKLKSEWKYLYRKTE